MQEDIFKTLGDILDSKQFNEMFDFETEQKEIKESGWNYSEIQNFGKELSKLITPKNDKQ